MRFREVSLLVVLEGRWRERREREKGSKSERRATLVKSTTELFYYKNAHAHTIK
jgi:hypothetical protein